MEFNAAKGWVDVFDDDAYREVFLALADAEFADHLRQPRSRAPPWDVRRVWKAPLQVRAQEAFARNLAARTDSQAGGHEL